MKEDRNPMFSLLVDFFRLVGVYSLLFYSKQQHAVLLSIIDQCNIFTEIS